MDPFVSLIKAAEDLASLCPVTPGLLQFGAPVVFMVAFMRVAARLQM